MASSESAIDPRVWSLVAYRYNRRSPVRLWFVERAHVTVIESSSEKISISIRTSGFEVMLIGGGDDESDGLVNVSDEDGRLGFELTV